MLLNISQASTKKSSTLAVGDEGAIADVDESVLQDLVSQVYMNLTERPHLHVPIQNVSLFVKVKGLRWHIKFEHFLQVVSHNKLN